MQRLISCLQRRVTRRATTTPKKAPPSPARKPKTATSPGAKPKTASSPAPKITSAPSLEHILVPPTTPINKRTSDVHVGSTTPAFSSSTSLRLTKDSVAWGGSTTFRGTTRSVVSSAVPSPTVSAVSGDAQSPSFNPFQINSSGSTLQRAFFRRRDARDPSPLSLVDLSSRRPKRGATSSPAQSVVGGTSPGNQYQTAREDRIDLFLMWMEDDHLVDIAEKLKRPRILRDFTTNPNAPQWYDQLVAWIARQYHLATYLPAVDSYLASTTSTQGDSPLSRFALIDSLLGESSWDDCLTFAGIERRLMVTFVTINKTAMVDDINNEMEYIKTNTLNPERTLTIRVNHEVEDSEA